MKISEILWKAANEHLSQSHWTERRARYSCDAIRHVTGDRTEAPYFTNVAAFLRTLGCDTSDTEQFDEFENHGEATERSQGARYAWLMFASMYAEELEAEGLL